MEGFNMIFASNVAIMESQSLEQLKKKYEIFLEGYRAPVMEVSLENMAAMESAIDGMKAKARDFIEDAHEFLDDASKKGKENIDKGKLYAYIGMGLHLLSALAPLVDPTFISAIVLLVGACISYAIMLYKMHKAENEYRKIQDYKTELTKMKSKEKNPKIIKKIDGIIERINSELNIS
jgi:Skp family chaperone for outer membrane proteins